LNQPSIVEGVDVLLFHAVSMAMKQQKMFRKKNATPKNHMSPKKGIISKGK